MRRLPSAFWKSLSNDSPTVLSLAVKPGRCAFVESESIQSTPFSPSFAIRAKSIISPSMGVVSILKSPVCKIRPAGELIARASASGIE